jgi:hypothetical protein
MACIAFQKIRLNWIMSDIGDMKDIGDIEIRVRKADIEDEFGY